MTTIALNPFTKKFLPLALSMILAANLAFFLYSYFGWNEGYWSVVTVVAVACVGLENTFTKMWTRLLATILGALYASLAAHFFAHQLVLFCFFLAIGVFTFSLFALQKSALSYAGIIGSVTMLIVLGASIAEGNYSAIAWARVYQVCLGIIILAIVNSLLLICFTEKGRPHHLFFTRLSFLWQELKIVNLDRTTLLTALKVVAAMLITVIPWLIFKYPGGFWAPVSCFFIMEDSMDRTKEKGKYRFTTHLAAALFGLVAVLILHHHTELLFIPLSLGLIICSAVLALNKSFSSSGNTMAIALAVMLLADPNSTQTIIFERFLNVMIGIGVGLLVIKWADLEKFQRLWSKTTN